MSALIAVKTGATFLCSSLAEIRWASVKLAGTYLNGRGTVLSGRGSIIGAGPWNGLGREVAVGGSAVDWRRSYGAWGPIFVGRWVVGRSWRATLRKSTEEVGWFDLVSSKREISLKAVRWALGALKWRLHIRCWWRGWRSEA